MSIYYLCIKTHKFTGLKYLCQTTQNPYTYYGSGTDWKAHLVKYGRKHFTEVIVECHSREELKYWGRHYSSMLHVVTAMDDFGNKIWANRIPETGSGAGRKPGFNHSTKTKQLIGKRTTGTIMSAESNEARSNALKGREVWNKGLMLSDIYTKEERSDMYGSKGSANPSFGKPVPTKSCPHCNIIVDIRNYSRSHGDKCRFKKDVSVIL